MYLYDLDQFRSNIDRLREHLFPESGLFFSMKANPLSAFSSIACEKSCGVEIASGGELALNSGVVPENIVFTGPGKTESELQQAIDAQIYMIHVESFQEIRIINQLAEKKGRNVPIALRINPNGIKSSGKVQMLPSDTDEGDIIVIEKSGAYGLTYSPYGFLSHRLPSEIGYEKESGFQIL